MVFHRVSVFYDTPFLASTLASMYHLSITADTLEFINTGKREEATSEAGSQTDTTSDVPVPSVAMPQENKEDLPF